MIGNDNLKELLLKKLALSDDSIDSLMEKLPEVMLSCAKDLDAVAIPGFGTFYSEKHDERIVENQSTGETVMLPPEIEFGFNSSVVLRKRFVG